MIDAVVGAMIMVTATSSLLLALDVAHRAFDQAGRYPLTSDEKKILEAVGVAQKDQDQFWLNNINDLPRDAQ